MRRPSVWGARLAAMNVAVNIYSRLTQLVFLVWAKQLLECANAQLPFERAFARTCSIIRRSDISDGPRLEDRDGWQPRDGEVRVVGAPQLCVKLGELARILKGAPGYGFPPDVDPGLEANVNWRTDALAYANACHVAEVEVDVETGRVTLTRYVALQDSGTLINPMLVDGQAHGAIAHGIGNAVLEWMGYDANAQPITTTFADYLLPSATELPMLETLYAQTPSPLNPLGAKGAGEVSTIPAAAAVIAAIEDALQPFGVHIAQTPVTPQKLVELINAG